MRFWFGLKSPNCTFIGSRNPNISTFLQRGPSNTTYFIPWPFFGSVELWSTSISLHALGFFFLLWLSSYKSETNQTALLGLPSL